MSVAMGHMITAACNTAVTMPQATQRVGAPLEQLLSLGTNADASEIFLAALQSIDSSESLSSFAANAESLIQASMLIFEMGKSYKAIELGLEIAKCAAEIGDLRAERRILSLLGGQYGDIADFASAMTCFRKAIDLAQRLDDALGRAGCLGNLAAVMQSMGHHRHVIKLTAGIVDLDDSTPSALNSRMQAAAVGLYSAHRLGLRDEAANFLQKGSQLLNEETIPLRRAFFERSRVFHLVDTHDPSEATRQLELTRAALGNHLSPRIAVLLGISEAVCDWGRGDLDVARARVRALYEESKKTRLYHSFVLETAVKLYSDATTAEEASIGLDFARELVEFTTSVKKAKFYRQLSQARAASKTDDVALAAVRTDLGEWLRTESFGPPAEEGRESRPTLAMHDELTVIHDDIARLRVMRLRREIRTDAVSTAENWAVAAEFFDDETGQHCYRVGHLAGMLARELGLDEAFCVQVEHAARLHDIGKIAVNEVVLLKPGPLDAAEMAAMRLHTEVGAQILAGSDDPTLKIAAQIAWHHHEWWNGAGYPRKLSARDIPLPARICAYADVYDALTHVRVYKAAWSHERALDEFTRLRGVQFDPDLFDAFVRVLDRYRADLAKQAIPGFVDMDSNALIASRKMLMETIAAGS